jgi:hypothetical protein
VTGLARLELLLEKHGKWDIRTRTGGWFIVFVVYKNDTMGEGRTLLDAVEDACRNVENDEQKRRSR